LRIRKEDEAPENWEHVVQLATFHPGVTVEEIYPGNLERWSDLGDQVCFGKPL
tara:strand:+ start:554 stop:712 length:159 start_codon:yes stop_codon:yes gene_type:complete